MGKANRNAAIDLASESGAAQDVREKAYPADGHTYQFFQLVELMRRIVAESEDEKPLPWLFSANASLGFAPTEVSSLVPLGHDRWLMNTHFLGLSGAQSPLPSFMLERLVTESEEGIKRPFLDFFNHRIIELFSDVWRKYRYYLRFEPNALDNMSRQFFALVGLSEAQLHTETPMNWGKMLSYAGTLASRSRSPQVVAGIIAHCFDLEHVSIREWEKRLVPIEEKQRCALGMKNISLGENSVIGDVATDVSGKFTICIYELSKSRFEDFLPSGKEFLPLCTLVEFVLREQLAYDLELHLLQQEPMHVHLSPEHDVKLGWSSFLGEPQDNKRILIQVRQ